MWVLHSISLLPPPRLAHMVQPSLLLLGCWLGQVWPIVVSGHRVSGVALGILAGILVRFFQNLPRLTPLLRARRQKCIVWGMIFAIVLSSWPLLFLLGERTVMLIYAAFVSALVAYAIFVSRYSPDDIPRLPLRWNSGCAKHRRNMHLELTFHVIFAALLWAATLAGAGWEWCLLAGPGRLAVWYLGQWVIAISVLADTEPR